MKWEKNKRRGVAMYVEGVMVNSGDRTGDVTVVWDNKNEEWHHWTGLYHCLHLPLSHTHTLSLLSMSIGEMCSCDMRVCPKQTCQNRSLEWEWAPLPESFKPTCNTNWHKYSHDAYMDTDIQKWNSSTALCLSTHSNVIRPTYLIQRGTHSKHSEPHRHSWAHACHTNTVSVFVCDGAAE